MPFQSFEGLSFTRGNVYVLTKQSNVANGHGQRDEPRSRFIRSSELRSNKRENNVEAVLIPLESRTLFPSLCNI